MFNRIKDIIFKIKDYDRLEHDYSAVLCHVTDGRLSKTGYEINGLLTQLGDMLTERYYNGYEDAEKDLALTWEDIKMIDVVRHDVVTEHTNGVIRPSTFKEIYEEVLRRFNELKRNRNENH